jgi:hypothetical protein
MAKIHVWIGGFQSEKDFNHYVDQSAYLNAWQMYNDGDDDYEGDDEPNENLRCQFCKEINLDTFDDDFIVLQFNKTTKDIKQLISIIPADADKLLKACKQNRLENGNALIYYTDDDLKESDASKCKTMTYLGVFEETKVTVVGGGGLQGLNNHLWVGTTKKRKEQFMEYFDQDGEGCQFCKDVGIKNYNPKTLYVYYGKMDTVENIIKNMIPDENIHDSILEELETQDIKKINAMICYVDNGFRDSKKDQTFLIYKKEFEQYKIKKTKKFIDEKDEYNDLKYIGCFSWD